jgi:hypothetical protein
VSYAAIFSLPIRFSSAYMSVLAIHALLVVLLASMVSGVISSSLIFKSTSSVVSIENGNEKQKIDSIITREDKELSRLGDHTSQFDIQNNKADANASQTEIALDDLYLRIERLETDNSYLKSKLKSSISEYEKIKKRYHMVESNYTKTLENNSDLEELVTYYQERIAIQNGSTLILKNKLSESISPPYTFIREREIFWVFKDSQGKTHDWSMPIDTYRALIERPEPRDEKILRSDNGREYSVRDHTKFVDPSSLSLWMDDIENTISNFGMNQSSKDSLFVYEAWYIVSQLTTYSPDLGEDPRWPLETLVEGGGDCEDFAILLASMLKTSQHTKDWQIQMVYFDIDHPNSPEDVNHVSLFIKTDEFEAYFDRSLDPSKNERWEYVQGWYFDI